MNDLGADDDFTAVKQQMQQRLITFLLRRKSRVTIGDQGIDHLIEGNNRTMRGIYIGYYEEADLPDEVREARHKQSDDSA